MYYYYEFWFKVDGLKDRNYRRKFKANEKLTIDKIKRDLEKYKKIREKFLQEIGLDKNYNDVELYDISRIDEWQYY